MLLRDILCLYPLGKLVGNGQRNGAVFYHGGDDFLRQMLLGRQDLWPSGLGNIVGFGNGVAVPYSTVLFCVFLFGKEDVSFLAGTDGASGFLPFIEGAGVGDFMILFVENEKVSSALRRTSRHEVEKAFHGIVILEHQLGLRVDSRPNFLTLGLLHGGVFFFGQLGLFLLGLRFLFLSNQTG